MPTRLRHSIFLLVPLLAIAAGVYWWRDFQAYETTDNAYLKAHIAPVSAKETGYIAEVLVQDNQAVQQGDVLAVIDDRDYRAKAAQAEAQLEAEQARLATLASLKDFQAANIREKRADVISAQADRERKSRDVARFDSLGQRGAVSQQARDAAQTDYRQAQALMEKNASALSATQSQSATLEAQVAETRAKIRAAEAALELARIDLDHTRIRAPLHGIVGNRTVQAGQLVRPGTVLAYLIPTDELWVEANFKEVQLERLRPGQRAKIRIDAYPDLALEGRVDSLAPASGAEFSILPPENATGNFTKVVRRVPVKIVLAPGAATAWLKPGLSTEVRVKVD